MCVYAVFKNLTNQLDMYSIAVSVSRQFFLFTFSSIPSDFETLSSKLFNIPIKCKCSLIRDFYFILEAECIGKFGGPNYTNGHYKHMNEAFCGS